MEYPELKRTVRESAQAFKPSTILIEDKNSGAQLIQELIREGLHGVSHYEPQTDKTTRLITFGRSAFEVHQGGNNSSAGCIVLDPDEYGRFRGFYATDNPGCDLPPELQVHRKERDSESD